MWLNLTIYTKTIEIVLFQYETCEKYKWTQKLHFQQIYICTNQKIAIVHVLVSDPVDLEKIRMKTEISKVINALI